jgi:hypothetical protein
MDDMLLNLLGAVPVAYAAYRSRSSDWNRTILYDAVIQTFRNISPLEDRAQILNTLCQQYPVFDEACDVLRRTAIGTQQDIRNAMFLEGRPTPS